MPTQLTIRNTTSLVEVQNTRTGAVHIDGDQDYREDPKAICGVKIPNRLATANRGGNYCQRCVTIENATS